MASRTELHTSRKDTAMRATHPTYYMYKDFLWRLKRNLPGIKGFDVEESLFPDGSPKTEVVDPKTRGYEFEGRDPFGYAIVPFWIVGKFGGNKFSDCLFAAEEMVNGLSHVENGSLPLAQRIIGVAPYIEMRQDRRSIKEDKIQTGQAIYAEIVARSLSAMGMNQLVLLDPHSYQGVEYLEGSGIQTVSLTAMPLFAERIRKKGLVDNTVIVSLDKGALQKCLRLGELLGLSPEQIVVFNKHRESGKQLSSDLLCGDPQGKDVIIADDIAASFESLKLTCSRLKEKCHCNRITILVTHGILSGDARNNVIQMLENQTVDTIMISDSLPRAGYVLDEVPGVHVVSVAPLMAQAVNCLISGSFETTQFHGQPFTNFILTPRPKEEVWEEFTQTVEHQQAVLQTAQVL